jgi:branched-chain amino acid transport system substrate-binding protein
LEFIDMSIGRSGWVRFLSAAAMAAAVVVGGCEKKSGSSGSTGTAPSGGGSGASATGPIKVGHYASMTGSEATFGVSTDNGIKMAIEERNASGGVRGRKVELITYDNQGKAQESVTTVTRLI